MCIRDRCSHELKQVEDDEFCHVVGLAAPLKSRAAGQDDRSDAMGLREEPRSNIQEEAQQEGPGWVSSPKGNSDEGNQTNDIVELLNIPENVGTRPVEGRADLVPEKATKTTAHGAVARDGY
eukprot:7752742-Alexandrium_andersonii.AAC.1